MILQPFFRSQRWSSYRGICCEHILDDWERRNVIITDHINDMKLFHFMLQTDYSIFLLNTKFQLESTKIFINLHLVKTSSSTIAKIVYFFCISKTITCRLWCLKQRAIIAKSELSRPITYDARIRATLYSFNSRKTSKLRTNMRYLIYTIVIITGMINHCYKTTSFNSKVVVWKNVLSCSVL